MDNYPIPNTVLRSQKATHLLPGERGEILERLESNSSVTVKSMGRQNFQQENIPKLIFFNLALKSSQKQFMVFGLNLGFETPAFALV